MTARAQWRFASIGIVLLLTVTRLRAKEKDVAYVPNCVDMKSFSDTIENPKHTHLNIAFENPPNEGGDLSFNRRDEILIAKANANGVKVLVSIGRGPASEDRTLRAWYFDLLSGAKRAALTAKLATYVEEHGFDGLDVDIEGPSINEDYGAFIRALAAALKPKGRLRSAALSQGYRGGSVPDSVFEHFDFINVMAYHGAGSWNPDAPGQHSSIEFAQKNVDFWLKRGLPASKTVLGVPFYG